MASTVQTGGAEQPAGTATPVEFTDGASPTVAQYEAAVDRLSDDPRIDIVLASIEPRSRTPSARQIDQPLWPKLGLHAGGSRQGPSNHALDHLSGQALCLRRDSGACFIRLPREIVAQL
mgnify:CR=1 FL=1